MKPENVKKVLTKFLKLFSKRLKDSYGVDIDFSIYKVGYAQNLEGKVFYHIFIDSNPEERSEKNQKYIKDEIKEFLEDHLKLSEKHKVIIELDKRPLYNIEEEKLPFLEKKLKNSRIREFSENVTSDELKWHFDEEDRMVKSLHKTDWLVQIDNEFPQKLTENSEIFIPKGVYHRLIKGSGNLKVNVRFITP